MSYQHLYTNDPHFGDTQHNYEDIKPGLNEAKRLGLSLGDDFQKLGRCLTKRASVEVDHTLTELKVKIFSGVSAALAITYAVFWAFAAVALWLAPSVPFEYSVTAIALLHLIAAGVLFYIARKPFEADDSAKEALEKSKRDIHEAFQHVSVKTHEIKKIANDRLNPITKVKRNPEAFLVGSFFLGIALSALMPSTANGQSARSKAN